MNNCSTLIRNWIHNGKSWLCLSSPESWNRLRNSFLPAPTTRWSIADGSNVDEELLHNKRREDGEFSERLPQKSWLWLRRTSEGSQRNGRGARRLREINREFIHKYLIKQQQREEKEKLLNGSAKRDIRVAVGWRWDEKCEAAKRARKTDEKFLSPNSSGNFLYSQSH